MAREDRRVGGADARVVTGRVLQSLNKVNYAFSLNQVIRLIDYDLVESEVQRQHENYIADCMLLLAKRKVIGDESEVPIFAEIRNTLLGIELKNTITDTRTSEEIIADVFKEHGITVV